MNKSRIVIVLLIIFVGLLWYLNYKRNLETNIIQELLSEIPQKDPLRKPTFEWVYSSFEEKEIPRTAIGLIAKYSNGFIETKEIDTIQGSCNEYGEPDKDIYSKSTMIICYYAGLGHYYKIIESESRYLVQRKIFEEAGPDYNPPKNQFETIATF